MKREEREAIDLLLASPEKLLFKKPFIRGSSKPPEKGCDVADLSETVKVELPEHIGVIVPQSQFLKELDPSSHQVLFDKNIPVITAKADNGQYVVMEDKRMALPYQKNIKNKHVLHLCGNPMSFSMNKDATDDEKNWFSVFKTYWKQRNMDGWRTKMVDAQKSMGDAALLFYIDKRGEINARLLCYKEGYVIVSHNDKNGDRILDVIYYTGDDNAEKMDCYDDEYHYLYEKPMNGEAKGEWVMVSKSKHGFPESPLITHRGSVAWDDVQTLIDVIEIIFNIFMVIQKRHGWGMLYIKGNISDTVKKLNGAIILEDKSTTTENGKKAEYLTPPSPQGMIETMEKLEEAIMKGAGYTSILPKDIKTGGDVSGVVIQLVQSLDLETALMGCIEWQNVASKMTRLFKYGLGMELTNNPDYTNAITSLKNLNITASFKAWKPRSEIEYNNMLIALEGAGLISTITGIEKNTESEPDEELRVAKQVEEEAAAAKELAEVTAKATATSTASQQAAKE